ncbi:MAG TPA: hypothetical protein VL463_20660 [Kofleriaceae bacterium]|jgi:hypothetical protein|nr:hypothetical protein [Kofleriaceae bacterium]
MAWLREDFAGHVEKIDDEEIVTEFSFVILPIWPKRSIYVHGSESIEIRPHSRSIVAGLLRTSTWMAALILALPVMFLPEKWAWLAPFAIALAAAAAALTFAFGKLDEDEQERRRMLRRVVGIGAPPEMLAPPLVEATRLALEGHWRDDHDEGWFEAIARGRSSELLAALAEYSGRPDLAREVRDRLADRHYN